MFHKKQGTFEQRLQLTNNMEKEYKKLLEEEHYGTSWRHRFGSWVKLEHPYQEGYFFSQTLDSNAIKHLPEEVETELKDIWENFVYDYFSMEKRPQWKKFYKTIDDEFQIPEPKSSSQKYITYHLFAWYGVSLNKSGTFDPQHTQSKNKDKMALWNKMLKYMTLVTTQDVNYAGKTITNYHYVLDRKWRKYFYLRRYDRIISEKFVIDGRKESREEYLSRKLWYEAGIGYKSMYTDYSPRHDMEYKLEGKKKNEKALIRDFRDEVRGYGLD